MKGRLLRAQTLVCLEAIPSLKGVQARGAEVFIGPCTTLTALLENPLVRDAFPVLAGAVGLLGSPLIRNAATIGGNIVTASPAADTLPAL